MTRRLAYLAVIALASVVVFLGEWAKSWAEERLKEKKSDE